MKSEAIILDATAGNRMIWNIKKSPYVLWIDIEPEVEPDLILDCTNTNFLDKQFRMIFFDPPHSYGRTKNTGIYQTPSAKIRFEKWGSRGGYYGFDKYPTKTALLSFIHKAQEEFYRILDDYGVLWFKWAEIHATLDAILPLFKKWNLMMKIEVAFQGKVKGNTTWWVMFMKKSEFLTNDEK